MVYQPAGLALRNTDRCRDHEILQRILLRHICRWCHLLYLQAVSLYLQVLSYVSAVNVHISSSHLQVVSFVPPDGEFELMNFRTSDNIQLPFRLLPTVTEPSRTRVEVRQISHLPRGILNPILPEFNWDLGFAAYTYGKNWQLSAFLVQLFHLPGLGHGRPSSSSGQAVLCTDGAIPDMCAFFNAQIQLRVSSTFELKVFAIETVITIPVR